MKYNIIKKYLPIILLSLIYQTSKGQLPTYVPSNGLVGWWSFSGNANDESGNGNHGVVNGATLSKDRFGLDNRSYSFNGTSSYIQIPNTSSLNPPSSIISISSWFKIDNWFNINNTGWFPILSKSNSTSVYGNYRLGLWKNPQGLILVYCNLNSDGVSDTITINNNSWNNIVITINDTLNLSSIYINGVLLFEGPTDFTGWTTNSTMPLYIGMDRPGIIDYAIGQIDDIGIWNRTLTQQEITDLYNGEICFETVTVTDTLIINMNRTSLNPITYENTLKVYPNPTRDKLTIDNGNLSKVSGYSIKITNSLGQQVFQSVINQQQFNIDITNWGGNGVYFLHLIDTSGNIIDIKKILLQ